MENSIIQQIRQELGGFRDEIRSDLKTVNKNIDGLRSDVDTNKNDFHEFRNSITKELQAVGQGLRSNTNDFHKFRNSITEELQAVGQGLRSDIDTNRNDFKEFRNSITKELQAVGQGLRTNTNDIRESRDSITKEVRAVRQELRSDIDTNTKDIHKFRNSVTTEFKAIRDRDAALRNALDQEFKSVDDRFQDVHQRFDEMKCEFARIQAIGQNGRLSNPFLPIHALPIYLPNQGITYPEATHFPKNANEFYALKQPTSQRQTAMLAYLAMFYDISNYKQHGEIAIHDPEETLGYLENMFGLEEERFARFRARAHELNQVPKAAPIKRSQVADVEHLFPRKRQHSRHSSDPESHFTYGPEEKLGWRHKSLSNPTEAEPTIGGLAKRHRDWKRAQDAAKSSDDSSEDRSLERSAQAEGDSGSTTNINTSRDDESEQEQIPILSRRS
ncbi:WAC domain protein [Fusarium subglutinans]|uniref:WAC domain protein n=1 Tax=Gibberella subglutinans TaxID=42677 RepID=A0A8H5KX79_GIBSU|nr:WAC domain protein [Fusarium subglutinans]KAF5580834.1 WAC domain protein [Fusarium subglutinans]